MEPFLNQPFFSSEEKFLEHVDAWKIKCHIINSLTPFCSTIAHTLIKGEGGKFVTLHKSRAFIELPFSKVLTNIWMTTWPEISISFSSCLLKSSSIDLRNIFKPNFESKYWLGSISKNELFMLLGLNFEKQQKDMFSPGIEPGTFCVLDRCDNRYTTKTSCYCQWKLWNI